MTLHMTGIKEHTIKIIGRWRSDAFIIYLQGQVASFTTGVVSAMSLVPWSATQIHLRLPLPNFLFLSFF